MLKFSVQFLINVTSLTKFPQWSLVPRSPFICTWDCNNNFPCTSEKRQCFFHGSLPNIIDVCILCELTAMSMTEQISLYEDVPWFGSVSKRNHILISIVTVQFCIPTSNRCVFLLLHTLANVSCHLFYWYLSFSIMYDRVSFSLYQQ